MSEIIPDRIVSPPDAFIERLTINKRRGTANFIIRAFGSACMILWTYRTKKEIQTLSGVETSISGAKTIIEMTPGPAMNCLEVLEGEVNGREYCYVRGTHKILGMI